MNDGRPACQQMGLCLAGCAIDAKWTTANSEIPAALATDRFELLTIVALAIRQAGYLAQQLSVCNRRVSKLAVTAAG